MTAPHRHHNARYQLQVILSRRDHAVAEVQRKLAARGFSRQDIADAVAWGHEHRLLNDQAFAAAFVASVLRTKAVGPRYLKAKLYQRGVPAAIAAAAIGQALPRAREQAVAVRAAADWKKRHPQQAGDAVRLHRHLATRGFSSAVIGDIRD